MRNRHGEENLVGNRDNGLPYFVMHAIILKGDAACLSVECVDGRKRSSRCSVKGCLLLHVI